MYRNVIIGILMNTPAHELIKEALEYNIIGWDFSKYQDRWIEEPTSWNYKTIVERSMSKADCLLDMGTGGGEFLSKLTPLPQKTYATESYPPNISLAQSNLEPFGIEVRAFDNDDNLPFESEQFDLVINRYDSFSSAEVGRILRPGGIFITEQVGGKDNVDINLSLGAEINHEYINWNLNEAVHHLEVGGFEIINKCEEYPLTKFYDIGAVVFMLRVIQWQIPNFSVETYQSKLLELHDEISRVGFFTSNSHRFFIMASKLNEPKLASE
jgi:SAM-dependent methyltransferase